MRGVEAVFESVMTACGAVAALLSFAVMAMVALNVALRGTVHLFVPGSVELSEYAMLLITAFASPWLLYRGQHVRIDLLLHEIPPFAGWLCELFVDILGCVVSAMLAWFGAKVLVLSAQSGDKIVKEFTIPEWWTMWPLPMMFLLLALGFALRLRRVWSGPRRPRREGAPV